MTAQPGEAPARDDLPRWTPGPRDWVVDATVEPPPAVGRRRRRWLLVGAAALTVASAVGGVIGWRAVDTGPATPQEAVELFAAAEGRADWSASWDLLCTSERQALGSVERWIELKETAIATSDGVTPGLTVVAGRARPMPDTVPPAYVVEYYLPEDSGMYPLRLVVVEEEGGFAVCSPPGSEA
ncbi:hypothetical protein ACI78R_07260 [Geodermatophilus sp. SYSU D01106]